VDGGKGQLNMARDVLNELAVPDLILLGVAKGVTRKAGPRDAVPERCSP
jgi:excinuclease ABC subunit C